MAAADRPRAMAIENYRFRTFFVATFYCTREASELLEVSIFFIRGRPSGRPADRKQSPNKTIDFGPFFSNYILTVLSAKIA